MRRVFDSGGPRQHSLKRATLFCLPNQATWSAPSTLISELNTEPDHTPVNAWPMSSRTPAHDSGTQLRAKHYHVTDFHRLLLAGFTGALVAVGMALTSHPPHRSGRAGLPHPAPASGQTTSRSLG